MQMTVSIVWNSLSPAVNSIHDIPFLDPSSFQQIYHMQPPTINIASSTLALIMNSFSLHCWRVEGQSLVAVYGVLYSHIVVESG